MTACICKTLFICNGSTLNHDTMHQMCQIEITQRVERSVSVFSSSHGQEQRIYVSDEFRSCLPWFSENLIWCFMSARRECGTGLDEGQTKINISLHDPTLTTRETVHVTLSRAAHKSVIYPPHPTPRWASVTYMLALITVSLCCNTTLDWECSFI